MNGVIRRNWLKRQVAAGLIEAKLDFAIERDGNGSNDRFGGDWKPCYLKTEHGDIRQGQIGFDGFDFATNTGMAYWEDADHTTIAFIIHTNLSFTLRIKTEASHG